MGMTMSLTGEQALGAAKKFLKKEMHKVYKPAGTKTVAELTSDLLVAENLGNVYNVADSGVTTSDFVEGPGKLINAGDNIDIVNVGSGDTHVYKFDLYMGADLSSKADKVANATSGHLAGLDSNGNLTDSGVSPTEEVTVEGNPVTFESPFEQDAKSVVVSVKPIQAGSGTPSPENIRPISGTNEVEIEVSGKNIVNWNWNTFVSDPLRVTLKAGTYTLSASSALPTGNAYIRGTKKDGTYCSMAELGFGNTWSYSNTPGVYYGGAFDTDFVITIPENDVLLEFGKLNTDGTIPALLELGSTPTAYEPYKGSTTTILLPSTLYGGEVDVTEGSADSRFGFADLGTDMESNWTKYTSHSGKIYFYNLISDGEKTGVETGVSDVKCTAFAPTDADWRQMEVGQISIGSAFVDDSKCSVVIYYGEDITATEFASLVTGQKVSYPLATPTTLSFTPADVELLEGTNVVSTNGEKIAVTYGRSLWQNIDDLKTDTEGKLDKSDVADVEGDTASRPYSVNEFMLRADGFYKVTQPIAQNASITSSNTTKTTVGEVLTALLNA